MEGCHEYFNLKQFPFKEVVVLELDAVQIMKLGTISTA
jgi:hypothetical protein